MKSKYIIKAIQEADPSGETQVSLNGEEFGCIEASPAYYDGCLEYKDGCGNLIITDKGNKLLIRTVDWSDFVTANEHFIILDVHKNKKKQYEEKIDKFQKRMQELEIKGMWEYSFRLLKRVQDGWRIGVIKDQEHPERWGTMWFFRDDLIIKHGGDLYKDDREDKQERPCGGEISYLRKSGFFKSVPRDTLPSGETWAEWVLAV